MVQRRAARFVTNRFHNRSSAIDMLEHLNWETLESRRTKAQLLMLFKIINGLVDIPQEQYLAPSPRYHALGGKKFNQKHGFTTLYLNSFFPCTIAAWNKLPTTTAETSSLVCFKPAILYVNSMLFMCST